MTLASAVQASVAALSGGDRTIAAGDLEVGILDKGAARRCFRRLSDEDVAKLL